MGSGTPVLCDFAKISALEHTGFKWRMGAPPPSGSHFGDGFGRSVYLARAGVGLGRWMDLWRKPEGYEVNT